MLAGDITVYHKDGTKSLVVTRKQLKVLATTPYFNFHFFPHLLIFLQFRDPFYVLNFNIHQSSPAEMT